MLDFATRSGVLHCQSKRLGVWTKNLRSKLRGIEPQEIKIALGNMGMHNLIHYRVIKDFMDEDHFGNCEIIIRIKKIDIRILRDRGGVYFEIKCPSANKYYFIKFVYEAMEMNSPQLLSNVITDESDIVYALKTLLTDLEVIRSFLYNSENIYKLEDIVKKKKNEFIGEFGKV